MENRSKILVLAEPAGRETAQWILKQFQAGEYLIYSKDTLPASLSEYTKLDYSLDENLKRSISDSLFDYIVNFGDRKFYGKLSNAQVLNYQYLNLWYYNKFRTFYWLRDRAYLKQVIQDLSEKYEKVEVFTSSKEKLVDLPNVGYHPVEAASGSRLLDKVKLGMSYLHRFVLHIFTSSNPVNRTLILSPKERIQLQLNSELQLQYGDPFVGYLVDKYNSDFTILDESNHSQVNTKLMKRKGKLLVGEGILVASLFNIRILREWTILKKKYGRILAKMLDNAKEEKDIEILRYLVSKKSSHDYYLFRYLAFRTYLKRKKPKAILAVDENSMFHKVVLDAAKYSNILTIGLQHGNIHRRHPAYMFSQGDLELHPMPDYTLVWGSKWKKVLIEESCYPETEIEIVGHPRTDIIPRLMANKKENSEFEILFASQPQPDLELRDRAANDVLRAAHELDIKLRIKLHPREYTQEYYHALAAKIGLKNYEIVEGEDLYSSINQSSIVLTCYSTVGAETVYFNKPLVIIDYLKEDVNSYINDQIAFEANNYQDLKEIISSLKRGDIGVKDLRYEPYVKDSAFRIDGKVANRIMEWLRTLHPITSHNVE